MSDGIRCMWMRGGTSKGGYFLASDLPDDPAARDAALMRIMGSPDPRQIDGMGGAVSLTSKVAVVSPSVEPDIDVEYLFLQVFVDRPLVSDAQTCGNILAGVAPFAIECGLVEPDQEATKVRIRNINTGQLVRAVVQTPGGKVSYSGDAAIDGVPGTAAPVPLFFSGLAGSKCGALLPTGNPVDVIEGVACTLIDNGMPAVVMDAAEFGLTGGEMPEDLDANVGLKARVEAIRLAVGPRMALGDVSAQTVPKMCLVSAPRAGGAIRTRTFIPHDCHRTIGVLGAVSVATACLLDNGPAKRLARVPQGSDLTMGIEHPGGKLPVMLRKDAAGAVIEAGAVRTARKLFDGMIFV